MEIFVWSSSIKLKLMLNFGMPLNEYVPKFYALQFN